MKILLIDPAGALVDFGLRCILEGHEVKQWIRKHNGEPSKIAKGLIERVNFWQPPHEVGRHHRAFGQRLRDARA